MGGEEAYLQSRLLKMWNHHLKWGEANFFDPTTSSRATQKYYVWTNSSYLGCRRSNTETQRWHREALVNFGLSSQTGYWCPVMILKQGKKGANFRISELRKSSWVIWKILTHILVYDKEKMSFRDRLYPRSGDAGSVTKYYVAGLREALLSFHECLLYTFVTWNELFLRARPTSLVSNDI